MSVKQQGLALYFHVPFCLSKCGYCDFNTYAGIEPLMPSFTEAMCAEARLWGRRLGRPRARTVFFGGGTPSYLKLEQLGAILAAARGAFDVEAGAETTIEANPDDVSPEMLREVRALGVNRLSMGVQSLDDGMLKLLDRRHDAVQALRAYADARKAGFDSLNLDLMYGLPSQTPAQWRDTLERVLEARPPHLSLYGLTVEHGTKLERLVKSGKLPDPDPDLAADMYELAEGLLGAAGYHHYEISNWAFPGHECKHNLVYWRNEPYLGLGPGAHSSLPPFRFHELRSPREYVRRVAHWEEQGTRGKEQGTVDEAALRAAPVVEDVETIGRRLEMAETMFLGLRLLDGLAEETFRARFGVSMDGAYGREIAECIDDGLLERAGDVLRLTQKGYLLANQAFVRFMG